jgi:transcriptional regulator with XRE-family HTH domain
MSVAVKKTSRAASQPSQPVERPNLAMSLKRLRAEREMSLSALAALSGLPQSTLSKVENGQMSLNYDKLVVLAEVFEIDVRQLFMTETDAAVESGQMARRAIDRASNKFLSVDHMGYRYLSTELRNRLMLPALFDVGTPSVPDHKIEMMDVVGQRFAFVVEGPVDFLCEQYEPVTLQTGDAIYIDSAMPHAFVTRNGGRARIVTVLASSNPEYLELAREATKQGAVDASNTFRQRARARTARSKRG